MRELAIEAITDRKEKAVSKGRAKAIDLNKPYHLNTLHSMFSTDTLREIRNAMMHWPVIGQAEYEDSLERGIDLKSELTPMKGVVAKFACVLKRFDQKGKPVVDHAMVKLYQYWEAVEGKEVMFSRGTVNAQGKPVGIWHGEYHEFYGKYWNQDTDRWLEKV